MGNAAATKIQVLHCCEVLAAALEDFFKGPYFVLSKENKEAVISNYSLVVQKCKKGYGKIKKIIRG